MSQTSVSLGSEPKHVYATVYYRDGSYRLNVLPSSAFAEVDFTVAGDYTVVWHDGWGEYSAPFTVLED